MNPEEMLRLKEREMCPPRLGLYVGLGDGGSQGSTRVGMGQ